MTLLGTNSHIGAHRQIYPDPFLDMASTKLPKSQQKLLEMCYLFATTHPQISPIVKKLAKYPITHIVVKAPKGQEPLADHWRKILTDDINVYEIAEGMGLDYHGYGNVLLTSHRPFVRSYECKTCKTHVPAGQLQYFLNNKQVVGPCKKCNKQTHWQGIDTPLKNVEEMEIVRIPPQSIHMRLNELTGKVTYYRTVPAELKTALKRNKPDREYIDSTPWIYVEAALNNKKIRFAKGKVFHAKEIGLSGRNMTWGMPIIMPALKDAYLNQVYKKADETVANERTVPARFVFPQATSNDPFRTISLRKWSSFVGQSMRRQRHDKNALIASPFPVGVAEIGGDAQRLFTSNLRELTIREIIGATGVPSGFLSEGMTFSGGSIELRMLENIMMPYSRALDRMLKYVVLEVSKVTGLPPVEVRFKPFRSTDDIQQLQILMQLAQMKHVSFREILDRMDIDWEQQHQIIQSETEKVQSVLVKENLMSAKVALESVKWQVAQQSRMQSSQDMLDSLNQTAETTQGALQHQTTFEQADQQHQQEQQQQGEQQQQEQQQQQRAQEAEVAKNEAEAERKDTMTDLAQENFQISPIVEGLVKKLLTMSPQDRDRKIESLQESAPQIAAKVQERLSELSGQESENQAGVDLIADLRMNAKDPKDLANKILMLAPGLKAEAFNQLMEQDPQLAILVAQHLRASPGGGQITSSAQQVDMRPQPKQRPPRRNP